MRRTMAPKNFQPALRLALVTLPLLVTACSVGPDYSTPTAPTPVAVTYKEQKGWKQAQPNDTALRGKWWEIYHDPQLNALEDQVNISNQNVLQAEAQFREAAAAVKVARADFFPTITANPAFTESQASQDLSSGRSLGISNNNGGAGTTVTTGGGSQHQGATVTQLYNLPVEATYLVDIWGSVRRNVEENSATAQASFANLENVRLTFQATLAQDYFNMKGLDAQAQLLQVTVNSYQTFVDLTTNRYNSGIASQGDVAQAKTQLETTKAQLVDVGVQRAIFEHAIAALTGKPATDFGLKNAPLTGIPPAIPVGVPSELLERRPDVAQAERQVAAANAAIGVQVAGYYPQLTINATSGLESIRLADLFSGPSFMWSLGADVAQTIFDAGRTHGQVQEAQGQLRRHRRQLSPSRPHLLPAGRGRSFRPPHPRKRSRRRGLGRAVGHQVARRRHERIQGRHRRLSHRHHHAGHRPQRPGHRRQHPHPPHGHQRPARRRPRRRLGQNQARPRQRRRRRLPKPKPKSPRKRSKRSL